MERDFQIQSVGFETLSEDFIRQCQLEDIDIAPAMEWVEDDNLPSWDEVKSASTFTRALHRQFDSLELNRRNSLQEI